ncbi:MAG: S4 domain-containing protein YaaA [Anaeroplasmataceae bacterium]
MEMIKIDTEYITLQQLLKISNTISSGGESKFYLSTYKVYVNNELENRRGKKLYPNDVVIIEKVEYKIIKND